MNGYKLGQIASLCATFLLLLAGTTSILAITIPSLIFGFLLVPAFILTITCVYVSNSHKNQVFGLLAIIFSIMYAVFISLNYYLQLGFLGKQLEIPALLNMSNADSIFMMIEILGYFFMGLCTLMLIPLFSSSPLEKSIKFFFLVNGLLGIGGAIGFVINLQMWILMIGLMVWNVILPVATLLLFFYFKRKRIVKLDTLL